MSQVFVRRAIVGTVAVAGVVALGFTGPAASSASVPPEEGGEAPPCSSEQLKLTKGEPEQVAGSGAQYTIRLSLKNISERTCSVDGLPTVDLVGPDHPVHGDTYRLVEGARPGDFVVLVPQQSEEVAEVTVLTTARDGDSWTPETIQATPPGQSSPLISEWSADLPVLRQDGATHPGSYVQGIS